MMGWYDDGGTNWAAMGLMMLFWAALIGLAVWAGVHFLRANGPTVAAGPTGPTAPAPRAVLDQRLASGEIDAEHYAQVRRLLDGQSAATPPTDPPVSS